MPLKLRDLCCITLLAIALPLLLPTTAPADPPIIKIPLIIFPPTVQSPTANSRVSSPLTISGTTAANRKVEVNVKALFDGGDQDLGTFTATANADGKWSTTPIGLRLPKGAKGAKYEIRAVQILNGNKSNPTVVTVLPPLNIIFKPIPPIYFNFAPQITSPQLNDRVASPLTIEGTAAKNNDVQINVKAVFDGGDQDLGTFVATSDADGKWHSIPINLWLPENAKNAKFEIAANQKVGDKTYYAKTVTVLPPIHVIFKPINPIYLDFAPQITSPEPNDRVASPLTVEGTAAKNNDVQINLKAIFDGGDQDLGTFTATADADGKWHSTPIGLWLPENAKNAKYEITASQKLGGKNYAKTITVLPPIHVILQPIPIPLPQIIMPPTITLPHENDTVSSPLTIHGTGVKGNTIEVRVSAKWVKKIAFLKFDKDKDFGTFAIIVPPNGKWHTSPIDIKVDNNAEDIEYTITAVQIYPGDKKSDETKVKVKG